MLVALAITLDIDKAINCFIFLFCPIIEYNGYDSGGKARLESSHGVRYGRISSFRVLSDPTDREYLPLILGHRVNESFTFRF